MPFRHPTLDPISRAPARFPASAVPGRWLGLLLGLLSLLLASGCVHAPVEKVPGETDIEFARITLTAKPGTPSVDTRPLVSKLGSRAATALYTPRRYNPFRVAEDERRIVSWLGNQGYLDAKVDSTLVRIDPERQAATLRFVYETGPRYTLAELRFTGLPEGESLDSYRRARPGGHFDLEELRVVRYDMAAALQRAGYGHAQVYVRHYVDRAKNQVHVVYFCDAGPQTTVGSLRIEGNRKVSEADLRTRLGLREGDAYDLDRKEKAEADLRDTGSFNQVVIETNADVEMYLGDLPDTGGVLPDERIAADGTLIPRRVPQALDLVVHVDEAPKARVRLRGSAEIDPTRIDVTAGTKVTLLSALGSQHHLVFDGRVGLGHLWRGETEQPTGLYGDALLRYVRPGSIGRLGDGRLSVRYRDVFYPGFHLRELTTGPGLRSTLARGLFFDVDTLFRVAGQAGFGPFSEADRERFELARNDLYVGAEASSSLIWDGRNDPVEPTAGHFLAARVLASPVGTNQYLQFAPEARGYLPLVSDLSLAARASYGWTVGFGDAGVPLGPRLFGGGAFGMRGYGRDQFSPKVGGQVVGGLSLAEMSFELRYLPLQKQAGIVVFTDLGGAGRRANPFDEGLSIAAGLGPRLRLWYVPLSLDLAYRFLEGSRLAEGGIGVFARIGEAF